MNWAINMKKVEDLHKLAEDFAVKVVIEATENGCPFGTYPLSNGGVTTCEACSWKSNRRDVKPSWCKSNCCSGTSLNGHPALGLICNWECPGQTQNANGCNVP